jgi:(E)-4-hydroxy-3-methylbut-2-enyl-diphosphate synthase
MSTGVAPAPLPHVRVRGGGIGFTRSVDFAKVLSVPAALRTGSSRARALVVRNSSTESDTMELEPASEGSPLLGINSHALLSLHVKLKISMSHYLFRSYLCMLVIRLNDFARLLFFSSQAKVL